MSETNAGQPGERTQEMHDSVSPRRALPVAVCGVICAAAGVALTVMTPITPFTPPNIIGMNLQFCAMLIGAGIFFYAKPTPGTRAAQLFCVAAVLLGMVGTVIYTVQAVKLRTIKEARELQTVITISTAAKEHARTHEGLYPADILVLIEEKLIDPEMLRSPFTMNKNSYIFTDYIHYTKEIRSRETLLKTIEDSSDYLYVGGDLTLMPKEVEKEIMVCVSNTAIMRVSLAVGFADGTAKFLKAIDVPPALMVCNQARAKINLPPLKPPEIMKTVQEEAAATRKYND